MDATFFFLFIFDSFAAIDRVLFFLFVHAYRIYVNGIHVNEAKIIGQ